MSLLDYDLTEIKKEMWEAMLMNTPPSLTHCTWCHDSSDSTCKCAELRFYNRLSNERIEEYIKERRKMEKEYIKDQIILKQTEIQQLQSLLTQL